MIVRCTSKLLAVIRSARLADNPPDGEDWYANLLWFSRRKCLLLTHAATLFAIFEPDVRTVDVRDPGRLVTGLIRRELLREWLPGQRSAAWDEVVLAKTADRSVPGCMNDMAVLCEVAIIRSGGLAGTNVADLNQAPRRHINGPPWLHPPIELATRRLRPD